MFAAWRFLDRRNLPRVACWYAYGLGLEAEWSPLFRGVYFKVLCFEIHFGYWKVNRLRR